jgi:hypothetical protein
MEINVIHLSFNWKQNSDLYLTLSNLRSACENRRSVKKCQLLRVLFKGTNTILKTEMPLGHNIAKTVK